MIIYLITNKINNKKYVGQTRSTLKKRFNQHCEKRNKTVIGNAIKKYEKQNFNIEILQEGLFSEQEINNLEIEYIKKYNSIAPIGYNIEHGGNASPMSDETKQKISNKLKGRVNTWKDKTSNGVKKLWENEEYRSKQTEQRKQKRGKYRDGIIKPLRLDLPHEEINQLYNDGKTINEISKIFNVSFYAIKKRISNEE